MVSDVKFDVIFDGVNVKLKHSDVIINNLDVKQKNFDVIMNIIVVSISLRF